MITRACITYAVCLRLGSRNAVYVNEERVGKSKTAVVRANDTIHFTKPGLNTKSISPTVYRFEILYVHAAASMHVLHRNRHGMIAS